MAINPELQLSMVSEAPGEVLDEGVVVALREQIETLDPVSQAELDRRSNTVKELSRISLYSLRIAG